MALSKKQLKKIVVDLDYVKEEQFNAILKDAKERRVSAEEALIDSGAISKEILGKLVADELGTPFIDLEERDIDDSLFNLIPEAVARANMVIFFEGSKNNLKMATSQPGNYELVDLLEKKTGRSIDVFYAFPPDIKKELRHYEGSLQDKLDGLINKLSERPESENLVVDLVNNLLNYAHLSEASDLHLEPLSEKVSVRFRVDGMLHEVTSYPKEIHPNVVFRIKVMSQLKTDEHEAAQDGRFTFEAEGEKFDVRVSIMPVTEGENIVLRLLSTESRRFTINELGLRSKDLEIVKDAVSKPYGMILSVGPTGSGKTTSLYAMLQVLNKQSVNIMTIEDPVEYDIEHVQQTQVNEAKELTFSTGLRSIVRQDPDIIMVGEIRDKETADIAVNSAMTGHLLLSTLHANDAATAFPRLIEMEVEPFLISSALNVVIAQRLVRKVCNHCRASRKINDKEKEIINENEELAEALKRMSDEESLSDIRVYEGTGMISDENKCGACNGIGYKGRTGIFEVLEVDEDIKVLINEEASSDEIYKKAKENGMTSMMEDGVAKVLLGVTSIEEVIRNTKQ